MKSNLLKEYPMIFKGLMTVILLTVLFTVNHQSVKTEDIKKSTEIKLTIALKAPTQFTADTVAFLSNEILLLTAKTPAVATEASQITSTVATNSSTVAPITQTVAAATAQSATVSYQYTAPAASSSSIVLANGNTAGEIGTEAAARMAAATGVPQQTWEYIIARESNGNPNVANPSGASGLFQTMPGWGSTATVDDQINAALNAYNNQGLAAWGMQ